MKPGTLGTLLVFVALAVLAVACGDDGSSGDAGAEPDAADGAGTTGNAGSAANAGNGSNAGSDGSAGTRAGSAGSGARDASTDAGRSGASGSAAGDGGDGSDASVGARPHPLYPALDLDTLPEPGGAASGAYEPPALPETTRTVMIETTGAQARADIATACSTPGTSVTVPGTAGSLGTLDIGDTEDCDISLGDGVEIELLYLGHFPGPVVVPVHRVRVRGGRIGYVMVDPGSTDLVLDGVTIDSGFIAPGSRSGVAIYLLNDGDTAIVDRFALINSVIRMVATASTGDSDGCAYLAGNARNVLFAHNNIVTAGNRNAWGFRIGGGDNFIAVDNIVRVSFHKLIRMNDGPVDYVYVKGGAWMREATLTAGGDAINDSFAQLGDLGTDHVYIHDTSVYLVSGEPVIFGASSGPNQAGKLWEARRIDWHARTESVVNDAHLMGFADGCVPAATCDYGIGTHSYTYDEALELPTDLWHDLPDLAESDPDALSIMQ